MGPLFGVNGDDSKWLYEEEADGSKGTLRDNYVRQLQPFIVYSLSRNTEMRLCLSVGERERDLAMSVRQKKQPYHYQTQTKRSS